jgi:peptidoglycan hydrolase CwlO-like protein
MDPAVWASLAGSAVVFLVGWLTYRATKRSTVDARAAAELQARDRLIEARDRDVAARDRFIDQLQEERDRLSAQCDAKDGQLHHALEQIDTLVGHNRILEEQMKTLRRDQP